MAKAVKMADIAKVMGVSTVTVSKALSDQKIWEKNMSEYVKENNIIFFDYEKMKEEQSENK